MHDPSLQPLSLFSSLAPADSLSLPSSRVPAASPARRATCFSLSHLSSSRLSCALSSICPLLSLALRGRLCPKDSLWSASKAGARMCRSPLPHSLQGLASALAPGLAAQTPRQPRAEPASWQGTASQEAMGCGGGQPSLPLAAAAERRGLAKATYAALPMHASHSGPEPHLRHHPAGPAPAGWGDKETRPSYDHASMPPALLLA